MWHPEHGAYQKIEFCCRNRLEFTITLHLSALLSSTLSIFPHLFWPPLPRYILGPCSHPLWAACGRVSFLLVLHVSLLSLHTLPNVFDFFLGFFLSTLLPLSRSLHWFLRLSSCRSFKAPHLPSGILPLRAFCVCLCAFSQPLCNAAQLWLRVPSDSTQRMRHAGS